MESPFCFAQPFCSPKVLVCRTFLSTNPSTADAVPLPSKKGGIILLHSSIGGKLGCIKLVLEFLG